MGSTPRILNEVDVLASMIKNGRDTAVQTLGKEPDILVIPFSLSDIQWLINNHSCFTVSLIGVPGQIDNHYPDVSLSSFCCDDGPQIILKRDHSGTPLNIY